MAARRKYVNGMELLRGSKFLQRLPALEAWLDQIVEFGNTRLGEQPWKADIRVMRPASMERADGRRFGVAPPAMVLKTRGGRDPP